jgi:hypothetical protein
LLQDFRDLRQGRPFSERDASSASSALSLDCGPASAAPSFGLILVGASLTRAASAELVRCSLFASDLILPDSAATKSGHLCGKWSDVLSGSTSEGFHA